MTQSHFYIYSTCQEAWDAMYVALEKAKKSIFWELYIFLDDDIGRPFFDLLERRAKEGIEVRLIVDAKGSGISMAKKRVVSLRNAGVDILFFAERKQQYRGWWKQLITVTHRKILVIDEKIGFIGGVNIDKRTQGWLDMHAQIEGIAIRSLLRGFAKMYTISGGPKENVKRFLKYSLHEKDTQYEIIYDDAGEKKSSARSIYIEAFKKARNRIILFTPYYFPDKAFMYAMWRARRRGVRVDLLIPFRSDLRIVTYAAYAWFSFMRIIGVKIHFTSKMMHGKGMVVDNDWAMIGSSNIDHTSFYDNYEANVRIKNKKSVERILYKLEDWLLQSANFDYQRWKRRGWWQKLKEWISLKLYIIWHKKGRDVNLDQILQEIKQARNKEDDNEKSATTQ